MGYDIREGIIGRMQKLDYGRLSMIGDVSVAFLSEQKQLKEQRGPKKRTFSWGYLGNLGHVLAVATKSVYDKIKAQHVFLLDTEGRVLLYQVLGGGAYSRLRDGHHVSHSVPLEQAVDRMLRESHISNPPH